MNSSRPNATFLTGLLLGSSFAVISALHLLAELLVLAVLVAGFVTSWLLVLPDVFLPSSSQVPLWALFAMLLCLITYITVVLLSSWRRPPDAVVGYGLLLGAVAGVVLDRLLFGHTLSVAYLVTDTRWGRIPLNVPAIAMVIGFLLICISNVWFPDPRRNILGDLRRPFSVLWILLIRGACTFSRSSSR